ncbi:iron-containing redox enzyme family protein [Acinetobacter sp. ME22]|uniref:TenA family transcriptional regulator n=1 Tax=Acinetobacter sp. ME22 TaxID=2904802 RepID=UPI001EDA034D|nr:iron-containing redox enzyme family protein [Acinetobacter sp. ME22]MCG2574622.1 iron-containing redox enzyme family protein [Acinetobacter sp. ME22]
MTVLKKGSVLEITPHSEWAQKFWDDLIPAKERVSQHPLFIGMATGKLNIRCFRGALLNFYPLVAQFPSYMALALAKATQFNEAGVVESRDWLIQNLKVEERHLVWYRDWARGFGVTLEELDQITPPPAMNAVNHFLWSINYRGSLPESLAATNLAIEWATGDWSLSVYKGIQNYQSQSDIQIDKRSLAWLRAHAHYDDIHPYEAMELIKLLCEGKPDLQAKAFQAAQEGLEYYALALDECYKLQHQ